MSFLDKLFGGGKRRVAGPSTSEALQQLLNIEEMLIKKQEYLEKKAENELQIAKKNGTKNKRAALQALKRKKNYEKQLKQVDGTLATIEYQRDALENAGTNTAVVKTMGVAADALKRVHDDINIDTVHGLMDDVEDQQQIAQEMSDAISRPFRIGTDIDEDELLKELEELTEEDVLKDLLEIPDTKELPTILPVAKEKPAKTKVRDDDDGLNELAAWAS